MRICAGAPTTYHAMHNTTDYCLKQPIVPTSQLQYHVNGGTCCNAVRLQRLVVRQLLSRINQFDLVHLNAFFFLQGLLDRQYLVFRFEIESLLTAC
jgi:hypothetical protein